MKSTWGRFRNKMRRQVDLPIPCGPVHAFAHPVSPCICNIKWKWLTTGWMHSFIISVKLLWSNTPCSTGDHSSSVLSRLVSCPSEGLGGIMRTRQDKELPSQKQCLCFKSYRKYVVCLRLKCRLWFDMQMPYHSHHNVFFLYPVVCCWCWCFTWLNKACQYL